MPSSTAGGTNLQLPTNIELPGIASDLAYQFEGGASVGSIVPSAYRNDNLMLPDLPQVDGQ